MADALGLVSNIAQVVDLLVKVGVMCSIYCFEVKNAPQDVRRILKESDRLAATLKDVERLLAGPNGVKLETSPGLRQNINECRLLLSKLVAKLDMGARHARAVWPFKKRDVDGIIKMLERHMASIALDLNIEQTALLLDIHQETVVSKLRIAEAATFDSGMGGDEATCLPGTRVDIIKQIQHWARDPNGKPILWLNGMAGTGKSTISRTVAQCFSDERILGASFFFKRGEGDRGRTSFIFTTIASQLVRKLPSMAPYIRDTIEADPAIHEKSMGDQFNRLILGPLKDVSISPSFVVVIDALDECDREENMRTMIHVLSQAQNLAPRRLKFFLTSRPELPIRLGFNEIGGRYDDLLLAQIPKPMIEHDIAAFIRHQLRAIRSDYNMSVTTNRKLPLDWPGENDIQRLVTMAIPLFIFAATMCRFLKDRRLGGPQNQLVGILKYQKLRLSNLDATYLPVLDQLLAGLSQSEQHGVISTFRYYVGSIVVLASPLSIAALARLLEVPAGDIEDHLDLLHSVLRVPLGSTNSPVRLLHLSFRDFLIDPEKKLNPSRYPFWVDERATHARLFSHCIRLLSASDSLKKDICSLRLPGTLRSDIDPKVIDTCLPFEVQYACLYWTHHLKSGGCTIQDGDSTHQFLTSHLLHWLEALCLLGRISESRGMVDTLLDHLDFKSSHMSSALLRDVRRIILTNLSILDKAPLQLYSSVLIFAPENSVVRKAFRDSFPSWISALAKVQSDWDPCLVTLEGHVGLVNLVTISPNSKRILSTSRCTVKLWDTETAACLSTYDSRVMDVTAEFSPDGRNFIYVTGDKVLKIWDTATGGCIAAFEGHTDCIASATFSPDGCRLVSVSLDNTLKMWDRATGACTATCQHYCDGNGSIRFSPDGTKVMAFSNEYTLRVLDVVTATCIATYGSNNAPVYSASFSPDGHEVALTSSGEAQIWNVLSGTCVGILDHSSVAHSIAFSPNKARVIILVRDYALQMWDTTSLTHIFTLCGHSSVIHSAVFSPDGTMIASASGDKTIRIWDAITGECIAIYRGHTFDIRSIKFSSDSKMLISASDDCSIKLWDTSHTSLRNHTTSQEGRAGGVISVVISPNGRTIASSSSDLTFKVWDTETNSCITTGENDLKLVDVPLVLQFHTLSTPFDHLMDGGKLGWPRSIFFSPDSAKLASVSRLDGENRLKIWDVATGSSVISREFHHQPILSLAVSPDGNSIASASEDGTIKIWKGTTGELVATYECHDLRVRSVQYSSDGTMLVSASSDRIRVWEITTGSCITLCQGHSKGHYPVISLAIFSTDGTRLASTSDTAVDVWDRVTGTCVATYMTDGRDINNLAFSPDGGQLAVAYSRGRITLRILNTATGNCIAEFEVGRLINRMAFNSIGLFTNVGIFVLDTERQGRALMERIGPSLSANGAWVTWNSHKMLWLPPTYRASASDVSGSTIAVGSRSGTVFWMKVNLP